jgi:DNA invertase Pin-like site-specific DNA recombinase
MAQLNQPTEAPKWVAYVRRSTEKQGITIDAQIKRIESAAKEAGAQIIETIPETESGKECDRKGIKLAMAMARKHGAVVVVAKYDRLSRDLTFASQVVFHSGVKFLILGFPPEAMTDPLLFGVYFGMAMREAQLISERTKAALAEKKAQGVKLGHPNAANSITDEMRAAACEARKRKAQENPNNIKSANEIKRYLESGKKNTLQSIADHLTEMGCYTSRGVFHTPKSVSLLCAAFGISYK